MTEAHLDIGGWRVESLRTSLFSPSPSIAWPPHVLGSLWERAAGTQPDSVDSRPREGINKAEGNTVAGRLLLVTQRNKMDWLTIGEPIQIFSELQDVNRSLRLLREATDLSLEHFPQVQRLALGVALIVPVEEPAQGLRQLAQFLPKVELDSTEGADFMYQVNRRRRSAALLRVAINRVARWSIIRGGNVEVTVGGGDIVNASNFGFARRLDLDINNDPRTGAMAADRVPRLLDELVSLASEIAIKGDVQ